MPKGYWIAHIDVKDPEAYKPYLETAKPAYEKYGAKFLVRGGKSEQVDGNIIGGRRHVVIEFESIEKAWECWNSDTYQEARKHRLAGADGEIVIVEGFE
jgi:uncharacterized protein (DUF1330 family)